MALVLRLGIRICTPNTGIDLSLQQMTAGLYAQHLQTALDDTIGPTPGRRRLEKIEVDKDVPTRGHPSPIGTSERGQPVYDSTGLAPDAAHLSPSKWHTLWIYAASVFSKEKVLRKPSMLEWLAILDYAGKNWYQGMSQDQQLEELLRARMASPPGKILKTFTFGTCQQLLELLLSDQIDDVVPLSKVIEKGDFGKGVMELKEIQRARWQWLMMRE